MDASADSLVVNPHKWLFTPFDLSVLYCRHMDLLRRAFSLVPEYLRTPEQEKVRSGSDYGIQLGRRFRALKAWVIWRSLGRAGIVARLREQVRMTNLFASWINADDRFELAAPVSMGVVCFRFDGDAAPSPRAVGARGRAGSIDRIDKINSEIVERINASGRAYLTQTKLRCRTVMLIGLGNVLTTEEHLLKSWELIREAADAVSEQFQITKPKSQTNRDQLNTKG